MKKKYIIGNWKMYPDTVSEARRIFSDIKKKTSLLKKVLVVIAPSFGHVGLFEGKGTKSCALGAQDVFYEEKGSFTGQVSAGQLSSLGVTYCIVGHSAKRAIGETDEEIAKKISLLLKAKITPVVCIGESVRDVHGEYLAILENQIKAVFARYSGDEVKKCIIAYEPIWAIGKNSGGAMKPTDIHETMLFIRKILSQKYGKEDAFVVPVLYGGSVDETNALSVVKEGMVDGLLIGRESLKAESFNAITRLIDTI